MSWDPSASGRRLRILIARLLGRLGLREDSFLLVLAVVIGIVTAWAAVAFHELIRIIRDWLYSGWGMRIDIYGRGLWALVLLPAAGGLAVGLVSRFIFRVREGHGVIDVIETVVRWRGVIRPVTSLEKILTSALTIGSGGSAGAEGPIVQIGAGIASGVGQLFRMARHHMPILIGCGSAAGISAIFNAPIGGVFFTLEVILYDFSLKAFAPVVLASVIANITTKAIFHNMLQQPWEAIFAMPPLAVLTHAELGWRYLGNFLLLGLLCGLVGVSLTRLMHASERWFGRLPMRRALKPALGGTLLGLAGALYVVIFGWLLLDRQKPIDFAHYPLPAFFSDGYGVIQQLVGSSGSGDFYSHHAGGLLLILLGVLCAAKILGTCLTLASGGSGGIIAPSLFLGAATGGLLGVALRSLHLEVQPSLYALVGMGAVLAAVVHAPLAAVLILLELSRDHKIILPAMLAAIVATGIARLIYRDSIYTAALRLRGVQVGSAAELSVLRRLCVEQADLEPATTVAAGAPFQRIIDLMAQTGATSFVVLDAGGQYQGLVVADDLTTALLQREAVPLLLVQELARQVPMVRTTDDLASVLQVFAHHDVGQLPVAVPGRDKRVIGLISRAALMRCYQQQLSS